MGQKISQQCREDFCSEQYPNKPKKDWMKQLPDSLYLSEISIPGTYKSASLNPKPYSCFGSQSIQQSWSIENQLLGGIRFIDLDTQIGNQGTELHIYDNDHQIYQKLKLIQVLDAIHSFLKKNQKEIVILKLNHLDDITKETSYKYILQQEIENFHTRPIIQNQRVHAKDWLFFENYIPRLGEVRGKLVLFRQFYGDVGMKFKQNPVQFKIQEEFQNEKIRNFNKKQQQQEIIQEIHVHNTEINQEDSLKKTENGEIYAINYITQKSTFSHTPFEISKVLNQEILKFKQEQCFLGIVIMNFPSEKIIDFIIKKCRERMEQKRIQKEKRLQQQQQMVFTKKQTVDLENRGHLDSICSEREDLTISQDTGRTQQTDSCKQSSISISIKNMKSQLTTPLNQQDEI